MSWVLPSGLGSIAEGVPVDSGDRAALVGAAGTLLRDLAPSLRMQPLEDRIDALVAWASAWADPRDPFRKEAVGTLPQAAGLSVPMVERGLDLAFESVTAARLRAWWEREAGGDAEAQLSAHITSSNVFVAGLPPVVASLLAGVPAFLRPPSSQPEFASLLARSWNERALLGGQFLAAASWGRHETGCTEALLTVSDRTYVFGDDTTVRSLRSLAAASGQEILGFGHRLSLAAVGREALSGAARADRDPALPDSVLEQLARDVLAWDGAGCLTPRWVFVEGDATQAEALARRAVPFVSRVAEELPAGTPLAASVGAERAAFLGQAGFSGFATQGAGWAVAALPDAVLDPAPPARAMVFLPLPDLGALPDLLAPLGDHLQGLLYIGAVGRRDLIASALAPRGLSLAVSAGMLQRPPIDWNHDGVRILQSLF